VLEGSARKSGDRIHLNAQLIDTRTDTHVWAEEYDRDLNDLFAIQSELAQKVAQQLRAKISTAEKLAVEQPPTTDLIAFDLYNRAKNLLELRLSSGLKANLLEAVDLLNQAVARDPSFFQAHCQLAYAHEQLYFLGFDHTPTRLALAEAAVERAFHLRPNAGETHFANARNLYRGRLDYGGALAELDVARQTLPNDARIFRMMGYIQRRQGRWQDSTQNLERSGNLDPRNTETLQQIALSYGVLRRYTEEKSVLDDILSAHPDCLFIAMPTPRKERFLAQHRTHLKVPYIMGVGGSLDIVAGKVTRAPLWMQHAGLEWLYRVLQEPRRMWWRYTSTNAAFAALMIAALVRSIGAKLRKQHANQN